MMMCHDNLFVWIWMLLVSCAVVVTVTDAYRIGESVDAIIWTSYGSDLALRSQMPEFGLSKTTKIPKPRTRFSMGFEDGLHGIPWTGGERLEKLQITFIYSKNSGTIHSVSSKSIERDTATTTQKNKNGPNTIEVEYKWIEEEPLDLYGGGSVMFLSTLISAVIFLVRTCIDHDDEDGREEEEEHERRSSTDRWDAMHNE